MIVTDAVDKCVTDDKRIKNDVADQDKRIRARFASQTTKDTRDSRSK
jgi:hypothetical protein